MTPREQGIEIVSREEIKKMISEKKRVEFLHSSEGYDYYQIGDAYFVATINEDNPIFGVRY